MIWFLLFIVLVLAIWAEVTTYKESKYGKNLNKKHLGINDALKITSNIAEKQNKFVKELRLDVKSTLNEINNSLEESRKKQKKDHEVELSELLLKFDAYIGKNGEIIYHNSDSPEGKKGNCNKVKKICI